MYRQNVMYSHYTTTSNERNKFSVKYLMSVHQSLFPPLISNRQTGATRSRRTVFSAEIHTEEKLAVFFLSHSKIHHRTEMDLGLW